MAIHILGIRHHGVGSARNVAAQLAAIRPDIVLVEGPPEITTVLSTVGNEQLQPPVAVMVYNADEPRESVFYPFAEYSPEWVAIQYANANNIPVRAMDLPAAIAFEKRRKQDGDEPQRPIVAREPLGYLAEAAGFASGEAWWDFHFEQEQRQDVDHFAAVMHAMEALRSEDVKSSLDQENIDREVFMRSIVRQAQNEMYERIAVVCGAWHAPALTDLDATAKTDAKKLKELPKTKVKIASTWIPWTNSRLSMFSGYGAGICSPGWYEHQWRSRGNTDVRWLAKVASTFRKKSLDISTAHIIEAVHLARALSSLHGKPHVSLEELNEATLSVMCMGDDIVFKLIREKLIVGEKLGTVPPDIPKVPLQEDFEQQVKSLRLRLSAERKQYDLDLRKENDLERSVFFHRLAILEIPWMTRTSSRTKGTFKESWITEWNPEMMVGLIDKSFLGNTVETAAQAIVLRQCRETNKPSEVAELIQKTLPAELYSSLPELLDKIGELSSISADIVDLMVALPRLIEVQRYGDVRNSDLSVLNTIVQQLLVKVFVGLPNACYGLDEDNSNNMFGLISQMNNAVRLYDDEPATRQWYDTLRHLVDKSGVHHIILGCVCRLLLDAQQLPEEEAQRRISFALSSANDPFHVAAWIEGFLRGSAMILIYDDRLWNLLYSWVSSLPDQIFAELLPLLRRAFSKFEYGERRKIGEKSRKGMAVVSVNAMAAGDEFNVDRARNVLPTVKELLGILTPQAHGK